MNGVTNHLGGTTTAIAAQVNGAVNIVTQTAGATGAGTEATAQAMDTSQNMITTLHTGIKGTTRAATATAKLISQVENPMEQLTPVLTLEVVTTLQQSKL